MKKLFSTFTGILALILVISLFLQGVEAGENNFHQKENDHQDNIIDKNKYGTGHLLTLAAAESYAEEIVPLVEKFTGKKLLQVPKIEWVSQDEFAEVIFDV